MTSPNKKNINEQKRYLRGGSTVLRNFISLTFVLCLLKLASPESSLRELSVLPTVNAMELNSKYSRNMARNHPIVFQDASSVTPANESNSTGSNNSNPFGYPFQDYKIYELIRKEWGAFLLGMQADYFASNATTCFVNSLNLAQYDLELLIIKLMYGNLKNNMLNTTLFLKNVSDLSYICLDAAENNYVFWVFKMDSFGRDTTQIVLGWLQNVLGNVLSVNKLV